MRPVAHATTAERLGRKLGQAWRAWVRQEARVVHWMVGRGVPAGVAKALPRVFKLVVFGVLLYLAFWLALLLVFAVIAAWMAGNENPQEEPDQEPEWREGPAGYGLYTRDDHRIDPRVFEDES